jgi:hypothetical protein
MVRVRFRRRAFLRAHDDTHGGDGKVVAADLKRLQ